jgi:hypothetical protein
MFVCMYVCLCAYPLFLSSFNSLLICCFLIDSIFPLFSIHTITTIITNTIKLLLTLLMMMLIQEEYQAKLQRDQEQKLLLFNADSVWQNQIMGTGWSAIRLQRYVEDADGPSVLLSVISRIGWAQQNLLFFPFILSVSCLTSFFSIYRGALDLNLNLLGF